MKEYDWADWIVIIGTWVFICLAGATGNYFALAGWLTSFVWFMHYTSMRRIAKMSLDVQRDSVLQLKNQIKKYESR